MNKLQDTYDVSLKDNDWALTDLDEDTAKFWYSHWTEAGWKPENVIVQRNVWGVDPVLEFFDGLE